MQKNKEVKVAMVVAGTGSFYCGTCIRDYGFYLEAKNLGYDICFVPIYLPVKTDDQKSEELPLLDDGIQMYACYQFPFIWSIFKRLSFITNSNRLLKWVSKSFSMTNANEIGALTAHMILGENGRVKKFLHSLCEKIIETHKTEVVILSNVLLIGLAPILKNRFHKKVFCVLQGEIPFLNSLEPSYRKISIDGINHAIISVDGFISVSDFYKNESNKMFPAMLPKNFTVYNGISKDCFLEQLNEEPIIGYLSRFCKDKGLDKLIDAFIRIREKGVYCELCLVGACLKTDMEFVSNEKEKLIKAGFSENVSWYPNADFDTKLHVLRSCRCLSVPAFYGESFGLYVIESLALGVPVVQPKVAAFSEILQLTNGGLLFDPLDSSDYDQKLIYFLENKIEANRMGKEGQTNVKERFLLSHMVNHQMDIMGINHEK